MAFIFISIDSESVTGGGRAAVRGSQQAQGEMKVVIYREWYIMPGMLQHSVFNTACTVEGPEDTQHIVVRN